MSQIIFFTDVSSPVQDRPVGANVLASYLRSHNYRSRVVNFFLFQNKQEFELIVQKVIDDDTIIVGFSNTVLSKINASKDSDQLFFGMINDKFIERLTYIKRHAPHVKFLLGGASVITSYLDIINQDRMLGYFDYVVIGQGESVVKNILDYETSKITSIKKDILLSQRYNTCLITDKIYPFDNFNSQPTRWDKEDCLDQTEGIGIEIARGCIFKCSYCNFSNLGKKVGDYTRNKEVIINEIKNNYDLFGITHYWCSDEIINDSEEKVKFILDIIDSLPFRINMSSYARLDLFWKFPWMIGALHDAGFIAWDFGIETINDKSGKAVGKGLGKERTYETLCKISDITNNEMFITAQWIFGLPYDTLDYFDEFTEFIDRPEIQRAINSNRTHPLFLHDQIIGNFEKHDYILQKESNEQYYKWTNKMGLTFKQTQNFTSKMQIYLNERPYLGNAAGTFNFPGFYAKAKKIGWSLSDILNKRIDLNTKEMVVDKIQMEFFLLRQKYIDNILGNSIKDSNLRAVKKYLDYKKSFYDIYWSPK